MNPSGSRCYIGIDPSLLSTGLASLYLTDTQTYRKTYLIRPPLKMRGTVRLVFIRNEARRILENMTGDIRTSAIEGPSLYSVNRADDLGSVRGVLKIVLADWGTQLPEEIPPTSLKKFATGNGNAIKENLIDTAKEDWGTLSNDEADAAWLAEFAFALNESRTLTQVQLEAIRGIRKMKAPKYKPSRLNIINI